MTEPALPALTPPRLPLGQLVATPAAIAALSEAGVSVYLLLNRHARGDWGELREADRLQNVLAVNTGERVVSSYRLPNQQKVLIITEADRAATTVLLPEDY
ncbi:hypothetical protein PI87_02845 [Ralstonia sp. A12]|uniref:hypothetical protein n=1 Tax=Ralstonia sp. A12 TaxID=1217052 RepID=UPI000573BC91|nr:hypothetical protein [Ralstonia sp. A12]KHK58694.1 hypothetical protein PI87_02845 [Ralstonia sp. A12]